MTDPGPRQSPRRASGAKFLQGTTAGILVLVAAVALTGLAWWFSYQTVHRAADARFSYRVEEITRAIQDRMRIYEQALWGGVGLFKASEEVSRDEWREYVETLRINEQWPGIQGYGYAIPLTAAELPAHVARIRAEGFPDFDVAPPGSRDQYGLIVYIEPFDWRNQRAFGYDMWSNEVRRAAMARSRDEGVASTSGRITLVQETEDDPQYGFITYVPVYRQLSPLETREQRREAFTGWVYAPFRVGDLMAGVLGSESKDVNFRIHDGETASADNLLFATHGMVEAEAVGHSPRYRESVRFAVQGRIWTLVFESGPSFISPAEGRQPTVIAVAGIIVDLLLFYVILVLTVSRRKAERLAVQLEQANTSLAERSRALELHSAHLERSNTELERFAYVASHDLQEPLRGVRSFSSLLRDEFSGQLGEEGDRWLHHISTSAERMSQLIRDLLRYSRIEHEEQEITELPLRTVVDDALENLSESIAASDARIDVAELPVVAGDRSQLTRLLQNLLSNAIKYHKVGGRPEVSISAERNDDYWFVSVRDQGVGIKPEYHQRVFEVFRRIADPREHSGTGIGLAICRKVAERHGGRIGVRSDGVSGSEFFFTLPVKRPESAPAMPHRALAPDPASSPSARTH